MHKVKCYYCDEYFDRDKEPTEKVTSRRYAHKACYDKYYKKDDQYEELIYYYLSKEVFLGMILDSSWYQMLKRQLVKYVVDDGYTYEGIYQALRYHYDVKKGDPQKSGGRIGIVPYVYAEAQKYYTHKEKQSLAALEAFEKTAKEATAIPVVIPHVAREPVKLLDMNSIFSEDSEC